MLQVHINILIITINIYKLLLFRYNDYGDYMNWIKYVIIGIVLLIILLAILKSMHKDAHLKVNKSVEYLGGIDNIVDKQLNLSRFVVTLRDVSKANKEEIQKLGAKGIVEIDNQLKIILGSNSRQLKKYIDDIDKK